MNPFSLLNSVPCSSSHIITETGVGTRAVFPLLSITTSRRTFDAHRYNIHIGSPTSTSILDSSSPSSRLRRSVRSDDTISSSSSWRLRISSLSSRSGFRIHSLSSSSNFGTFNPDDFLQHDILCTLTIFVGSFVWIKLFDILVKKNFIEQKLSRKLMHISTGVLYVMSWPLFSVSPWSRFFAVSIPLSNVLKLLVYGTGILKDEGLVKSISRMGTSKELLRGPLYYVLVLSVCTVFFWRESPVGMLGLATMCGGDGFADIIGRKMGGVRLPYNPNKSWAGSISMFVFGFLLSISFLYYYSSLGFYLLDWTRAIQDVALISFVATLVESLPLPTVFDDNLTVPCVSILFGLILFPMVLS